MTEKTEKNTIHPFLSQEYCRFSLYPSFFTNQNFFDTNGPLLLHTI